ncbi:MAG: flavodoxin [Treponema sp. CETP13]|nr:MAG: flavodoxin [Treponema sp. CETP13]
MFCTQNITDDIIFVGGSDRRLSLFENAIPIPNGITYNSYIVLDEKTILLDTVDKAISALFFENVAHALNGKKLDYVVINHMEPDHAATLEELILRYPEVTIVGNNKTFNMIKQFFTFDIDSRMHLVKEGDVLSTGAHSFSFYMAPMVHWPEVMVTYDATSKALFTADAFGTFKAFSGNIFADQVNFERDWLDESRRYYSNIVGKYGMQTTNLLKKMDTLDVQLLCPLHGPIWRENISWYVNKYKKWGSYTPEDKTVVIAYGSIYGNTENAAHILANKLSQKGICNIEMYDTSVTHPSYILSEAFRVSHLVFASSTYNGEIFQTMQTLLHDVVEHNMQNRTVAFIENGTWAPQSGKKMKALIEPLKNMTILDTSVSIKSSVKTEQLNLIDALATQIVESLK